ncbi:hypothetical protein B566_EDAN009786 [Ephemera danica]|nr:hypothetical protein B566_EDAN009786 [Ephemera danica]
MVTSSTVLGVVSTIFVTLMGVSSALQSRPHIVYILCDDMGWNDVGFTGHTDLQTPNIDALAYHGRILTQHYALPTCTPSRSALLTGKYPIHTGMQGYPISPSEPRALPLYERLMPQYFKDLGYQTHLVGKWHLGHYEWKFTPTLRKAFDSHFGYFNGFIGYYDHDMIVRNMTGHDLWHDVEPQYQLRGRYLTDLLTEVSEAMMWSLDKSVGRIVDTLARNDMLTNSIIVFASDNGAQTIGMYANHGSNFPLKGLFHISDWLPTLYTAAGGDTRELSGLDGRDQWEALLSANTGHAEQDEFATRSELLVNIDEVVGQQAIRYQHWKLVKGSYQKRPEYDGYWGTQTSGENYNINDVATSLVSTTLGQYFPSLDPEIMEKRRDLATLRCSNSQGEEQFCIKAPCLFDMRADPCEHVNLATSHPDVVQKIEAKLETYMQYLKPQLNVPNEDALADPKLHNKTWMPWHGEPAPAVHQQYCLQTDQLMRELITLFSAFLLISGSSTLKLKAPSPNIIFILADDLGWNDVGFTGNSEFQTPNIDALAYNGRILTRYYSLPFCTPSRSALYTSRYASRSGMQGYTSIPPWEARAVSLYERLMPEYFKDLGYQTHLVGKWHLGHYDWKYMPTLRGTYDTHFGILNGFIGYYDHNMISKNVSGHDFWRNLEPQYQLRGRYATDLLTEESVRLIEAAAPGKKNSSEPLFLFISHMAIHAGNPGENDLEYPVDDLDRFSYIPDLKRRKLAAMAWNLDKSVGRVVKCLADNKMLNNSIIVFASDNGAATSGPHQNYGSNFPFRGMKTSIFEGGVHVPAAIWSSKLHGKGISRQLFHVTDWLPTLFHAVGTIREGISDDWSGNNTGAVRHEYETMRVTQSAVSVAFMSLLPFQFVTGEAMAEMRNQTTVQCDYTVEIVACNPVESPCLFDLASDPCERINMAASHPDIVEQLKAKLDTYRSQLKAQFNTPYDQAASAVNFNNTWMPWKGSKLKAKKISNCKKLYQKNASSNPQHLNIVLILVTTIFYIFVNY